MVKHALLLSFITCCMACNSVDTSTQKTDDGLNRLIENYYEKKMQLFPLEAMQNGDNRYNHILQIDFTNSFRDTLKQFYSSYLDSIKQYNPDELSENDRLSYDIFTYEMQTNLEGLSFNNHYIPFQQFWGLPLTLGQLGSGDGTQPFKTVQDYDNWLKRAARFSAWTDSAIVYFRKGIEANYVLPKALVEKMIPQAESMVVASDTASLFYAPVRKFPRNFSDADKEKINVAYTALIRQHLVPSYQKLRDFLKNEYLPKARMSSGINSVPGGDKYYQYLVKQWTTTNKTPGEIYNTGLSEVERIRRQMDSVKQSVGFTGDLNAFFNHLRSDAKFTPYKSDEEVLNAFRLIQNKIDPHLNAMFSNTPKTKFEVRQTEAFREASASAEYTPGSPDGSRPGIFYVPIVDAKKYNITSGLESLFLHEAIPGHHYQISLQQENTSLPKFRRFSWYGAYGEGWALYCESLGPELGLYKDPYQYMGALGDEMHRAIRLVVDVAIHTKGWSREQAIKYMMDNEAISEQGAIAEIERYMAIPGQALSYKIGSLKIAELRQKFSASMGEKFELTNFHDEFLKDGCMPLEIVERKMAAWAKRR